MHCEFSVQIIQRQGLQEFEVSNYHRSRSGYCLPANVQYGASSELCKETQISGFQLILCKCPAIIPVIALEAWSNLDCTSPVIWVSNHIMPWQLPDVVCECHSMSYEMLWLLGRGLELCLRIIIILFSVLPCCLQLRFCIYM